MSKAHKWKETKLVVENTGTVSAAFSLEPWTTFVGAYFPEMDDGDIGLEYSLDGGANYAPILDSLDGADLIVVTSGEDVGWMDISDFIRAIPRGNNERLLRFTCAAQTPAVVITLTEES